MMRSAVRWLLMLAALPLLTACPADETVVDGSTADQGPMMDATTGDASPMGDASIMRDATVGDGGTPDAGPADAAPPTPLRTPTAVAVGDDPVELFVQFAATAVTTSEGRQRIWTRAYGLEDGVGELPGPTFEFQPGDLLQITLNNLLSAERLQALIDLEMLEAADANGMSDELIHVAGEINVPHNADNTNLHTHGLHVDPSRDDVTLVITPEGDSAANYAPELQPVIREQIWPYQYRIPALHLPGTHWYHAHKHGSTATHVENGMAGALIVRPTDDADAIVPALDRAHDRVLLMQVIDNFGVQEGTTDGAGHLALGKRFVAINGDFQPFVRVRPGQVERWRLINAAANHRSLSYVWLGRRTGETANNKAVVEQVPMHLVAIDGVTLPRAIPITADRPLFMGPGNRADVVVALPAGDFGLFKNYPKDITVRDAAGDPVALRPSVGPNANPYLFALIGDEPGFAGLKVAWASMTADGTPGAPDDCTNRDQDGNVTSTVPAPCTPIAPLLRVAPYTTAEGHTLADVTHDLSFPEGRWQPIPRNEINGGGGGKADTAMLMNIVVDGAPVEGPAFDVATLNAQLDRISPTGANAAQAPSYVSAIRDDQVLQSRSVTFDISGISADVPLQGDPMASPATVRQFTLNGRQFALDDAIGDPIGLLRVGLAAVAPEGVTLDLLDRARRWLNEYWSNPGYYAAVRVLPGAVDPNAPGAPVYQYSPGEAAPSIEDLSGLPHEAVVNPACAFGPAANTPGLPVATTGESWTLINNSAVAHPFHIHINPFFVTEVGQLSYETFADGPGWALRTINADPDGVPADASAMPRPEGVVKLAGTSDLWWVVNTWWDTIVVPPHGYVKMRYWMNVPEQAADSSFITDDVNRSGSWVYHCHILRHEDRGMMMRVETQPLETP